MQDDVRASLEDLAIRWETPKGRELKAKLVADVKHNRGEGIAKILEGFLYVNEVPGGRDLRGITLEGEDLSEAVFGKCDLSWASLARSNLQRADLRSSTLKRADLTDANLSMARLDFADCSRADFSRSTLDGTHFKEARLTGAVFEGADASRASFESASLAKANFRSAKLEQTNFFNADCNNSNFDGNGLERVAARPAKAWGLRFDMDRDEFERQVGLKAITSRTTKRFKGLDALLKLSAGSALGAEPKKAAADGGGDDLVFGAPLRGTQKLKPVSEDEALHFGPAPRAGSDDDAAHRPTTAYREEGEPTGDPGSAARRRPPPPPRPTMRRPAPMALGAPPGTPGSSPGAPAAGAPAAGPPTGRTGRFAGPPPTARGPRPPQGTGPQPAPRPAPPPPPKLPVAPLDPDAPEPLNDWAKTIGQLMQLKPTITKILVEVAGEKSRLIYKVDPPPK